LSTAFLGTSDFAATVLRRLAADAEAPGLVMTPPDSRQGRGRKLAPPPAAAAARELGLELHQTASVNEPASRRALAGLDPDVVIVCAFGQLIKEPLLSEYELLNAHPSLLPRWRGAAPIERAIMAGDEITGTTIMAVTAGLDSGPVALGERSPIGIEDYFDDVSARLAGLSGALLARALELKREGELSFTEQDEREATYADKISPDERRLDPSQPAAELAWKVRGLNPHIGTHLELVGGDRLGVRRAHAAEQGLDEGRIVEGDGMLLLGTADAALALEEVQPPGKRAMPAAEFVRGYPIPSRAI
jgi:methionyl-tRNA formyltransferase